LWQGRFSSFPLYEAHLYTAAQYIELNPMRAGLVEEPWQYPWSSAALHLAGCDDRLVRVKPLLEMFGDWREYLTRDIPEEEFQALQRHERTGRPLGDETFLASLKETLGLTLRPRKSGPKGPRRKELNK
jgi:putative transposase